MEHLIKEANGVADAFFSLTKEITEYTPFDLKTKELILLGTFTASNGIRGIATHVERALKHGATREEVIGAIILALPVVGVSNVNQSLTKAMEIIDGK